MGFKLDIGGKKDVSKPDVVGNGAIQVQPVKHVEAATAAPATPGFKLYKPPAPVAAAKPGFTLSGKAPASAPAPKQASVASAAEQQLPPATVDATKFQHVSQPDILGKQTQEQFVANLELLRNSFEHKELMVPATRRILLDLQEHPEFAEFLAPEDIGLFVKMMRTNYGNAIATAESKKRKPKKESKPMMDLSDLAAFTVTL